MCIFVDFNLAILQHCGELKIITIHSSLQLRVRSYVTISTKCKRQFTFKSRSLTIQTRSSATAEKQRVSCPHGGEAIGPPAHSSSALSGYTYMRMVESETRNKRTSSVPSINRTLR